MLQGMDHMKTSCVIYVQDGKFDQFQQSTISVLTITSLGIVMLIGVYDLILNV